MTRTELFELIRSGEDSTLEFKRDGVSNVRLAKELVAFLNLEGGTVLVGVEDDGSISGTNRPDLMDWVSELCRTKIDPPIVPLLSWAKEVEPGRDVLAVRVTLGPNKPYACFHNHRKTYYIRVGTTAREASRDELERMFQSSGRLHYGLKPVPGASLEAFTFRRLRDYVTRVFGESLSDDLNEWKTLLQNLDLMTLSARQSVATVNGLLLFGRRPNRYVPQAGIRAICYEGTEPGYSTRADEDLRGPMVPILDADDEVLESGLVEQAWDFVRRNTRRASSLQGARRHDRWDYPEGVLREAIVNALVHRDYSIAGTDIMLAIYANRLEIQSPGRLPNTVTPDGMRTGMRYARNQTLVNIMRDYRYVDARGMGVRTKMIPGMKAHNGTVPDLIEEENRFTVRLWRELTDPF